MHKIGSGVFRFSLSRPPCVELIKPEVLLAPPEVLLNLEVLLAKLEVLLLWLFRTNGWSKTDPFLDTFGVPIGPYLWAARPIGSGGVFLRGRRGSDIKAISVGISRKG